MCEDEGLCEDVESLCEVDEGLCEDVFLVEVNLLLEVLMLDVLADDFLADDVLFDVEVALLLEEDECL